MENTFRDVNIAIANEFARQADQFGVDIWEAIRFANLHPRISILKPGPGVGGHCISVDPWFLVEAAPDQSQLIRQARLVNDAQPAYVLGIIDEAIGVLRGKRVAALGLAYKPDVDDLRQSPAIEVVRMLVEAGAEVVTYEPYLLGAAVAGAESSQSLDAALQGADVVVLLVDHQMFHNLNPEAVAELVAEKVAIDTRGIWDRAAWEKAGFHLRVVGVGVRDD
jgi:UDP-N-acetyl-D-mannosaminuronic acid dehydrogenase